jgi:nucleotide-binding universal stress UspA family protein
MEVKKILWPTDFSKNAARALPYVTSLTEKYETEIHVLYVIEELVPPDAWYGEFDHSHIEKIHKWEEKTARKRLDEICKRHLDGCPHYIKHIAIGDPAQEILKFVEETHVDMVVMAKRGQKGHFRFGSVSEKIVKNALVPVVTVPIGSEK